MAESQHQPSMGGRKCVSLGGKYDHAEGDSGLAQHLERLSRQLDNIQAEHSQLFHNKPPDRNILAKATTRFLSHNERQSQPPTSKPAVLDQEGISLQAAAAVASSKRRPSSSCTHIEPGASVNSSASSTTTSPSPPGAAGWMQASLSSRLAGEQGARRCNSTNSRLPPTPQPPLAPASPGSVARRLQWAEATPQQQQQQQQQQHQHPTQRGAAPLSTSTRFAVEQLRKSGSPFCASSLSQGPAGALSSLTRRNSVASQGSAGSACEQPSTSQQHLPPQLRMPHSRRSSCGSSDASSVSEQLQGTEGQPDQQEASSRQTKYIPTSPHAQGRVSQRVLGEQHSLQRHHISPSRITTQTNKMGVLRPEGVSTSPGSSGGGALKSSVDDSPGGVSASKIPHYSGGPSHSRHSMDSTGGGTERLSPAEEAGSATSHARRATSFEVRQSNMEGSCGGGSSGGSLGGSFCGSGSHGGGSYSGSFGGGGSGDLASRMAAGRARRAARNTAQAQAQAQAAAAAANPPPPDPPSSYPVSHPTSVSTRASEDLPHSSAPLPSQTAHASRSAGEDGKGGTKPQASSLSLKQVADEIKPQHEGHTYTGAPPSSSRVRTARQSSENEGVEEAGADKPGWDEQGDEVLTHQGQARKRHRVSELPDRVTPGNVSPAGSGAANNATATTSNNDNTSSGATSAKHHTASAPHSRAPSRIPSRAGAKSDGGGGSSYVALWAATLPPLSHALDPCPTTPSPTSSSGPTGPLGQERIQSGQPVSEVGSRLPSHSSIEEGHAPLAAGIHSGGSGSKQEQEGSRSSGDGEGSSHDGLHRQQREKGLGSGGSEDQQLLSLALQQQQQQLGQHQPCTPSSHPSNLLGLVAQLRQQHAQRASGANKLQSRASDPPVLQMSAPVFPEAPSHSVLQPAPVRAPPPASRQHQQQQQAQQGQAPPKLTQQQQAPSPPRGHLSRFQTDDSVLFGSPIRRPESATTAGTVNAAGSETSDMAAAAGVTPAAHLNASGLAPTDGGLTMGPRGAEGSRASYQAEPRTVLYEPSRYQDEEEEGRSQQQQQQQQQQRVQQPLQRQQEQEEQEQGVVPTLVGAGQGEDVRLSLTFRIGQLAVVQVAPSLAQSPAKNSTPSSPSPALMHGQTAAAYQQQPPHAPPQAPTVHTLPPVALAPLPSQPLPKPSTWRAGEKPSGPSATTAQPHSNHASLPFSPTIQQSSPPPPLMSNQAAYSTARPNHQTSPPPSHPAPSHHPPQQPTAPSSPLMPQPPTHSPAVTSPASPHAGASESSIFDTRDDPNLASPYAAASDKSIPMTPMTNATQLLSPLPGPRTHASNQAGEYGSRQAGDEGQGDARGPYSGQPHAAVPAGSGHPIFAMAGTADSGDHAAGSQHTRSQGGQDWLPQQQQGRPTEHQGQQLDTSPRGDYSGRGRSTSPSVSDASQKSRRSSKLGQLKERRQQQQSWEVWHHRSHSPGASTPNDSASFSSSPPHHFAPSGQAPQHLSSSDLRQSASPPESTASAASKYPGVYPAAGPNFLHPPHSPSPSPQHPPHTAPLPASHAADSAQEPGHLPQGLELGHGFLGLSSSYATPKPDGSRGEQDGDTSSGGASRAWLPRVGTSDSPCASPSSSPAQHAAAASANPASPDATAPTTTIPDAFGIAGSSPFSLKRPAPPGNLNSNTGSAPPSAADQASISVAPPILVGSSSADSRPVAHSRSSSTSRIPMPPQQPTNLDTSSSSPHSQTSQPTHWHEHIYDGAAEQGRPLHSGQPHSHSFSHSPQSRPGPSKDTAAAGVQHERQPESQQQQPTARRSAALLRLKQQRIQRHQPAAAAHTAAHTGLVGPSETEEGTQGEVAASDASRDAVSHSLRQDWGVGAAGKQATPLPQGGKRSAAVESLLGRLQEHRAVRPATPLAAPRTSEGGVDGNAEAVGGAEGGVDGEESPDTTPKPFLKRRSCKVLGSKIDWSHVKPRTVSRLDYTYNPYTQQSTDASPPWSYAKPGVSKAKQQRVATRGSPTKQSQQWPSASKTRTRSAARSAAVNSSGDSWKPTRQDRFAAPERTSASGRPSSAAPRPRGVLPGADYEVVRFTGIPYPSGNHLLTKPLTGGAGSGTADVRKSNAYGSQHDQQRTPPRWKGTTRGAAQAGVPGSPLDDLLVHVNSLLKDFDTKFAASSTPSRSAQEHIPVSNFSVERANDIE